LSLKIGDAFLVTRGQDTQYSVHGYQGGSIGIRGRIASGENLKSAEAGLYQLREGSTQEIEIETDDGKVLKGSYKINELNWKKERKENGEYELLFNIGLQKIEN
jgi:ribonuclease HI